MQRCRKHKQLRNNRTLLNSAPVWPLHRARSCSQGVHGKFCVYPCHDVRAVTASGKAGFLGGIADWPFLRCATASWRCLTCQPGSHICNRNFFNSSSTG